MPHETVDIRKRVASCHFAEPELEQLVHEVGDGFADAPAERWVHRYRTTEHLAKKQPDGSRKATTSGHYRVQVDRQIVTDNWPELLDRIRAKQRSRRVQHLRVELSSGDDRVWLEIGNEVSVFNRAGHRVDVEGIGAEARLIPIVSDVLARLSRPNERASRWIAIKWAVLATCFVAPIALVGKHFERQFRASGADVGDVLGRFAATMFVLVLFGAIPYLILASWLSDRSASCVVVSRAPSRKSYSMRQFYEKLISRMHDSWFAGPFLKDPVRGSVLLALFGLVATILSLLVAMVALAK